MEKSEMIGITTQNFIFEGIELEFGITKESYTWGDQYWVDNEHYKGHPTPITEQAIKHIIKQLESLIN